MGDQGTAFKLKLEGFEDEDTMTCPSTIFNSSDIGVGFIS